MPKGLRRSGTSAAKWLIGLSAFIVVITGDRTKRKRSSFDPTSTAAAVST